jgi:predicted phosphoadenosine phosphosulfate sulfurtransferase
VVRRLTRDPRDGIQDDTIDEGDVSPADVRGEAGPGSPTTVLDAAHARLDRVFADFDTVVVAFSGGKDSGAMLHLVLDHMRQRGIDRPVHVSHLDYEGQYSATTEYVDSVMADPPDLVVPWRVCPPVAVGCAASMFADHWKPWDPEQRDRWVRPLPDHPGVVHAGNVGPGFPPFHGVPDYAFQDAFARWLHQATGARRTAVLIGIREEESLHRYSAINREDRRSTHDGLRWTSRLAPGIVKAYPIHDWRLADVWHAHARFDWPYNRLYDLTHLAGVAVRQMRVSSPFISQGLRHLSLYRVIEPAMWGRVVGCVNGANFAALYATGPAMAAKQVTLPAGHTWATYLRFLLTTLPGATSRRYLDRFDTSVRYWTVKGGALPTTTVDALRAAGVQADYLGPAVHRTYSRPHEMVRFERYPDDLPGIPDFASLPSYKRMCVSILRNDHTCRYMGFGPTKSDEQKRRAALAKYEQVAAR